MQAPPPSISSPLRSHRSGYDALSPQSDSRNFESKDTQQVPASYQQRPSVDGSTDPLLGAGSTRLSPLRPESIDTAHLPPLKPLSVRAARNSDARRRKRFELWQGSHVFLFGGRLMLGSDPAHLALSYLLLVASWGEFLQRVVSRSLRKTLQCMTHENWLVH